MRSQNKSRSRNKSSGRNRGVGNVINRVFDSAGPEGKVRGTPQQIIEKYQTLARDAQVSGDRVAAENFQQHAEHYTRLLSEAQREQAERQEAQQRQANANNPSRGDDNGSSDNETRGNRDGNGQDDAGQHSSGAHNGGANGETAHAPNGQSDEGDSLTVVEGDDRSEMVDTPEAGQKPRRSRGRTRRPAKTDSEAGDGEAQEAQTSAD